jgi:hypothetical protein
MPGELKEEEVVASVPEQVLWDTVESHTADRGKPGWARLRRKVTDGGQQQMKRNCRMT